MDENLKRRLMQFGKMSAEGGFGAAVQAASAEYRDIPLGMDVMVKLINDFYVPKKTTEDATMANIANLFCAMLIVIYRDSKKHDPTVAMAIANSFLQDYAGVPGSCLFSRWDTLARASLAFKVSIRTEAVLVWEQAKNVFQAYNEFLNGLLGYMILGWRCALGKPISPNVINSPYGAKLNEFSQLTDGEDGAFYLIFRLAKPGIRNAIAHGSIWLDNETGQVTFEDRAKSGTIDITDFVGLATIGSHLAQAYLVAIATIVVLEDGSKADIAKIPAHLVQLFGHPR